MPVPVPIPIPVPSPNTAPAPAKRSSSSSSSSGSGSGSGGGGGGGGGSGSGRGGGRGGRRQASSPPTAASRPTSRSRYSPPQPRPSTSPRTTTAITTTKNPPLADAARMPPPPPPPPPQSSAPRTASLRNRRAANEAPPRRTGRTPSVSAAGGRAKAEDEKLALATAASKSLGNVLGVGAKPTALKSSTSDPAKLGKALARGRAATVDKAPDGGFGRAMSLRSRTAGKTESSSALAMATGATTTTRARAGTGAKRGANTVGATSKQDPSMAALPGGRRPSTASLVSTTTTSMPPPPPAAKGHRRSASGVNATTPPTPTTTTSSSSSTTTTTTTAIVVPSINTNPRLTTTTTTTTTGSTKTKRPAFSALTQDFTVPTNPNPPPSPRSRIVPPPPLDTSTLHAQTQLLQLLTLRSSSAAVYQQLIASATATLKSRFEKLSARHYDARETSAKKQKRHNIDSLAAVVTNVGVGGGGGRKRRETTVKSPEERVQAFSEAIKRIDAMRSGEFRVLCAAFGEWISGYNPRGGGSGSGGRERWIDGIGGSWRRECVGVCRKLEAGIVGVDGVAGVLAEHGEVEALVTTVSRVAEGYRELAEGMLEEVEMMGRMETEVVERERMDMGRRVKAILEGGVMESVYTGQGIWAAG